VADTTRPTIDALIVDDERNIRRTMRVALETLGCRVQEAIDGPQALATAAEARFDLILLDLRLAGQSGLDLVAPLRASQESAHIVIVTAYGTIESAVAAMRHGATDYLTKPFAPAQVEHLVQRARQHAREAAQVHSLRDRLRHEAPDALLESDAPAMTQLLETLATAAAHEVPVLLRGEHGTGKTLLARYLHERSRRSDGPFVIVNCPTLSEELLASELFGHVRGAFTGAVRTAAGKVEAAEGGTLFLDEIGEVSIALQAKLLRFVQDRAFERVGDTRTRQVDVRVLAATNRDLDADVAAGRFREDLLYRLNTVELRVPPLRERREDIPRLARLFAEFTARASGRATPQLSPGVLERLVAYAWPGNVRELKNAVERALIFTAGDLIETAALPERIASSKPGPWLGGDYTAAEIEDAHIARVVQRLPTQEAAAKVLGLDVSTLWRKRKRQS
jgi:NtrC-family two-component system response regulator AlgB